MRATLTIKHGIRAQYPRENYTGTHLEENKKIKIITLM